MNSKLKLFFFAIVCLILLSCPYVLTNLYASDKNGSATNISQEILRNELAALAIDTNKITGIFKKVVQLIGPSVVKIKMRDKLSVAQNNADETGLPYLKQQNNHIDPQNLKDFNLYKTFELPDRDVGSGFIIDKNGIIVTNYHVIKGFEEKEIEITLSGNRQYIGQIIGFDLFTDIAVLKINEQGLETSAFENETKTETGDWVVTIGNPYGHGQSVSTGIISAMGRKYGTATPTTLTYADFIQIDATINPGCSGGPLVNLLGEVIGINAAIATRRGGFHGIGFAIPAAIVKKVVKDLIDNHMAEIGG